MTVIGFTGSRHGLTNTQDAVLDERANCGEFGGENHHGDCVGADAAFHYYAWRCGGTVIVHPPTDPTYRAFVDQRPISGNTHLLWEDRFVLLPGKPYLERNRDIVQACDRLIACPASLRIPVGRWPTRGGTFYAMRYALGQVKPITIIWSDGEVEEAW